MSRYFDEEPEKILQVQPESPFQVIDKMLKSVFGGPSVKISHPEITETAETYQICVSLPNITADDLNISVENRDLILKVRIKSANSLVIASHHLTLPKDAQLNSITADVKDGLLTIIILRYQSNQFKVDINYN